MRLKVASLLFFRPIVYATYRGTFSAYYFDLGSIGKSFGTGSLFSLKALGTSKVVKEARPMINLPLSLSAGMIQYFLNGNVAPGPPREYSS